ncbi:MULTISPECIES: YwmB family TATA-box binding protein [Paraliobacillus]|uniref:YwmB family TATA-box binding protein n=1 Tax=Paraliobacillus TaxID=200903 RepID=UPI000DD4A400|nr:MULTISPECIES: YwmB family TATA-box binding protein [Paraliobacillus]
MIKNKGLAIILLVLLIFTFHLKDVVAKESATDELVEMMEAVEAEALQVKTWQIMMREQISKKEMPEIMHAINQIGFSNGYTTEKTEQATKYKWDSRKEEDRIESIIMVTSENQDTVDVIYKMESLEAGSFNQNPIEERLHLLLENVFSKDVTKFTCISTEVDAIIGSDYFFDRMIEKLDVEVIDEMNEKDFNVMSGYTDKWEAAIPSLNKSMNIQLAARKGLNGKITLTIGTPILTTEY